jgi:hypothetical protein
MPWSSCLRDDGSETLEEADRVGVTHTAIQHCLVKLGADMGFEVHVASGDQGSRRADDLVSLEDLCSATLAGAGS